jgi:hypothetical protein
MFGLSVNEYNALFQYIKDNINGVKDEDIDLCLRVLDGVKSGRISEEREIEITDWASVDADWDGDDDVTVLGVYTYPKDLIDYITNVCLK